MKDERLKRLQSEVAASNITRVADKIGMPRCTLSLVVNEKYPANPENVLKKFEAAYGGVHCPYLDADITRDDCNGYANRQRPSNPLGLNHWRTCQHCSRKTGEKP